jgi:hypothetical protein
VAVLLVEDGPREAQDLLVVLYDVRAHDHVVALLVLRQVALLHAVTSASAIVPSSPMTSALCEKRRKGSS